MFSLSCQYDPAQHYLMEPELLSWCKRQTSDRRLQEQLFVYRQLEVGTFVIAMWVNGQKGQFIDLVNLGFSLRNFTREMAGELRRKLLAPASPREVIRALRDSYSTRLHAAQDQADMETEHLKKKWRND